MDEGYEVRVIEERTGREVKPGDTVTGIAGGEWVLAGIARGPLPGQPARMYVTNKDTGKLTTLYAAVVGLIVEEVR